MSIVGPFSLKIPEKDRSQRDDGSVVIVTNGPTEPEFVRHETIHAAQCFASEDAMASALEAAVKNGRSIAEIVDTTVAVNPALASGHRDLFKLRKTWEIAKATESAPIASDFVIFEMMQAYYPTKETAALVAPLGFIEPGGVYASMTAYLMREVGKHVDGKLWPTLSRHIRHHQLISCLHLHSITSGSE